MGDQGALPRWRTGTVASGGEDVYYEVTGEDGPVVVLTHGAGGSHAAWFQQVPPLAAAGYRVVTWDARGFGCTTYRSGVHGAAAHADDLEAVLDAVGIDERVHLVGQSMGGWWVTEFAVTRPARTRSLALCDTVGALWTDELRAAFTRYGEEAAAAFGAPVRVGGHPALGPGLARRDPATAFLYQQLNTFHAPPMLDVLPALEQGTRTHAEVAALGIPVLVLAGADDPIFPAPLLAHSAARIDGARFVEVPDAGHSPYFEHAAAFNAALLAFLTAG